MNKSLSVSEIFGPTFQGEGRYAGSLCHFLRLAGCFLHCKWCDSAYTWRFDNTHPHNFAPEYDKNEEVCTMSIDTLVAEFLDRYYQDNTDGFMLVITGGEPLLQANALELFLKDLNWRISNLYIEIETAGVIFNEELSTCGNISFNVSPKLENSGNPKFLRYKPEILSKFNKLAYGGEAIFKFVVSNEQDFVEIDEIVSDIGIDNNSVYIMLEGATMDEQQDKFYLVPEIIKRRYNFSPRIHTMLWGNKRGK